MGQSVPTIFQLDQSGGRMELFWREGISVHTTVQVRGGRGGGLEGDGRGRFLTLMVLKLILCES